MTLEATIRAEGCALDHTPVAAVTGGQVLQTALSDAGIAVADIAAAVKGAVQIAPGVYRFARTASIVILKGGRVYWDHSANTATFRKVGDRDFYLGRAIAESVSGDTTVDVKLNYDPCYDLDLNRDPYTSVLVGTAAAAGFNYPTRLGGAQKFELTATSEAQKVDALGVDSFAVGANAVVEFAFRVTSDGASGSQDISIGVASATHASDADSIAESAFIHLDGNVTTINAECDDGTNETAATDTTKTYTEGATLSVRKEVWIDMSDMSSLRFFVDGVRVLSGTTFSMALAAGPLFPLVHVEKASGTDVYVLMLDWFRVRFSED